MGLIAERLALLISANPDDAIRGLNKLEREAGKSVGRTEAKMDNLGHSLTRIGAGMLSVGVLGGVGLVQAARSTSDLNEAISLTEAIFGDASDEIGEFAAGAASSIGQSERAAREATAQFGGLLDNLGFAKDETVDWSKDLTVLASDLGSAFNTDPADAVQALGSALRGESEPIRRYNVMLDDATVRAKAVELGLAATSAEVDNHGKVQARLALIMEQTSSVQGNFAETADGMANASRTAAAQFENFQASLGQAVLPMIETVLDKGNSFLEWFNELDPATQKTITQMATLAAGLLVVGGGLGMLAGKVIKWRDDIKKLTTALQGNVLALTAVAAVAITATMVYQRYRREQELATARVNMMTTALQSHETELGGVSAAVDVASQEFSGLRDAMDDAGVSNEELAAAVSAGGDTLEFVKDKLLAASRAAGTSDIRTRALGDTVDRLRTAYVDAGEEIDQMATLTGDAAEDELPDAESAIDDITAALEDAEDKTRDFEREWSELVGTLLGGLEAETRAQLLIEDIAAAVEDLDGKTTAEVQQEVIDLVTELAEIKGAAAEAGTDITGLGDTAELGLLGLMLQADLSEESIKEVGTALAALDGQEATANLNLTTTGGFGGLGDVFRAPPPAAPSGLGQFTRSQWEVIVSLDGSQLDTALSDIRRKSGGSI